MMKYSSLFVHIVFLATLNLSASSSIDINLPTCGNSSMVELTDKISTYIEEDNTVEVGYFPWHAAIFRKNGISEDLICGATIISSKYLITSSSCFPKENIHAENYRVAVGIIEWRNNNTNNEAKFYNLEEIRTYPLENNITSKQAKIVLIKTNTDISFDKNVLPICLRSSNDTVQKNDILYTAGWTTDGNGGRKSSDMRSVKLPFLPYEYCRNDVPPNASNLIKNDTFCTKKSRDPKLDHGDLGGGLAIKKPDNKFYLVGIIDNFVDSQQFTILYSIVYVQSIESATNNVNENNRNGIANSRLYLPILPPILMMLILLR